MESLDKTWEHVFRNNEWGKYPDESFIRFVARNFYKTERATIKLLEVGCGPGANIWYMAREGFDVYGIDGSHTAIEQAKRRLAQESLSANLQLGDVTVMPYENETFDAVADNECLTHNSWQNLEVILSEINRVLKPNGLFYSRTFTEKVYTGKTRKEIGRLEFTDVSDGPFAQRGFVRLTTKDDISRVYGEYFNVLSIDKIEFSLNSGQLLISEWVINAKKDK